MTQRRSFAVLFLLLACLGTGFAHARPQYDLDYLVRFLPEQGVAAVTIRVTPDDGRITRLDFAMDPARYTHVQGDGEIERGDARTVWVPPREGGEFRYRYRIDHRRGNNGYDARITSDWTILRGDDLFPPARTRTTKGADSRARLRFELPEAWNGVDTQYRLNRAKNAFVVVNPARRFDRPTGWIIAGDLGVRREDIGDTHVAVAAPRGQAYPRMEILGYVNATAAELEQLGELPSKLLIVGGEDPMWRGGLSAPRSLWMHASRPLISENGTSALLHELFHVVTGIRGAKGEDWIAEGLAEYYSIVLLNRAGLLSDLRRDKALDWMRHHGRKVTTLRAKRSTCPRTARAAALFAHLNEEMLASTDAGKDLDDVVRLLGERGGRVTAGELRRAVKGLTGREAETLQDAVMH